MTPIASVVVPTLFLANLRNPFVWIAVVAMLAFGAIGFVDDYLKVTRHSHHGLFARYKFAAQIVLGRVDHLAERTQEAARGSCELR